MRTVKGARVSSNLGKRKAKLLDAAEKLGHSYGCIHTDDRSDREYCGCLTDRTVCHNCKQEVIG